MIPCRDIRTYNININVNMPLTGRFIQCDLFDSVHVKLTLQVQVGHAMQFR